jgi:CRP-like cAMP-binding protein
MARPDPRRLKDAAAEALRGGNHEKALVAYLALARLQPSDGRWPQRAAEMYRRLGKPESERAALEQAADSLSVSSGEPLEELLLTEVIPAARPLELAGSEAPGVSEIPLDATIPPDPAGVQATARVVHEMLPKIPLFSSLDQASFRRLIDGVRLVSLGEGEELFHQGDPGDALYVIVEGAVVPIAEGEVRKKLAVLEEGEFFGEIALVTHQARSATIEALVDTTLLSLDRSLVASLLEGSPKLLKVLLRFLRDRLIQRLVRTGSLFAPLDSSERDRVAERFRFLEVREGAILIRQRELSDALFVLLAGEMEVIQSGVDQDRVLARLGVGDVFGEMSVLTGDPAIASVVAKRKSWVLALPREDVDALLKDDPRIQRVITDLSGRRRAENAIRLRRGSHADRSIDLI